jgi:multimeric flavodoxin WrbA
MKVVCLSGSRTREGQTARAVEALARGLEAGGARCQRHFLPELQLDRCRQCDADGWGQCREKGRCCMEDDLPRLISALEDADLCVFATPVYFGDLAESLRAFLDRLRRTTRHAVGLARVEGRRAFGLCVAGGGGGGGPSCLTSLDKVLRTCGFDVIDMVAARRQNLEQVVEVLEQRGRQLASAAVRAG